MFILSYQIVTLDEEFFELLPAPIHVPVIIEDIFPICFIRLNVLVETYS